MLALSENWRVVREMGKTMNYSIGFTTRKGVCLDLDDIIRDKAEKIADYLLKKYSLEGYLLIESSPNHYHVVFNRYTSWRKTIQIIFSIRKCHDWATWQAKKGELTLRVSTKKEKKLPRIVQCVGYTDKLISDYLEIYNLFNPDVENVNAIAAAIC